MSDLIDRQAAIDKFEPWLKVKGYNEGELNMLKAVLYELKCLPSVQPEIVRCKDCKYYDPIGVCIEMSSAVCEDSFCCWAERRTDG